MRIVECNHPGVARRVRAGSFHCLHGDPTLKRSVELEEHQVGLPRANGDFHLVPVAYGQGRTGKMIFSIIVGGALLWTGVGGALGFAALGAGAPIGAVAGAGVLGLSASTTALMGAGLLLGGISMLLAPSVATSTGASKPTSFTFDGPSGTGNEGGPVPLVYGEIICGGVTIASDIRNGYGSVGFGGFGYGSNGYTYGGGRRAFDTSFSVFNL